MGLLLSGVVASAEGMYDQVKKKDEAKRSSRWTLEEWLGQRDRNRMMDLWLSMNSASPYEFYIAGENISYKNTRNSPLPVTETTGSSSRLKLGAFSSLVGLEGEYENNSKDHMSDLTGMFSFRIFGNAVQSTNITLSYGLRNRNIQDVTMLRQQFGQVSLSFYLLKSFGIQGLYRGYVPTKNDTLGTLNTEYWHAGPFIDFDFFRVYGNYFNELSNIKLTSPAEKNIKTGVEGGIQIFF